MTDHLLTILGFFLLILVLSWAALPWIVISSVREATRAHKKEMETLRKLIDSRLLELNDSVMLLKVSTVRQSDQAQDGPMSFLSPQ